MEAHAFPKVRDRAKLQLLDRAFRSFERRRDVADALVFDETHLDHAPLQVGQSIYELKQADPSLQLLVFALVGQIGWLYLRLASLPPPVVRQPVGRQPKQP